MNINTLVFYNIENFVYHPQRLNRWRGKEDNDENGLPNQGDYFDIFLNLVRTWYMNGISDQSMIYLDGDITLDIQRIANRVELTWGR